MQTLTQKPSHLHHPSSLDDITQCGRDKRRVALL